MSLLTVSGYRVSDQGAPITVRIEAGDWIGISGPSEVNLSRFLAEFAGKSSRNVRTVWIDADELPSRKTVQQLAKIGGPDQATRILTLLRLWDVRRNTIASLNPSQKRAAAFIQALADKFELIFMEESLDALDPWVLPGVLELIEEHPSAKVVLSMRPDVLVHCQRLVILNDRGLRFDGAPSDLLRIIRPAAVEVETDDAGAIGAMIEPLQLQVHSEPGRMTIHTTEGQKLAANLCVRGYPLIKAITVRTPTLAEALLDLIR